jgi:hypothetical protein
VGYSVGEPAALPPVTVAGWVNEPAFRVESGSLRRKDRSSGGKVSRIRSEQAKDEGERTRQETQYKKAVGATVAHALGLCRKRLRSR